MRLLGLVQTVGARSRLVNSTSGWARLTLVSTVTAAERALRMAFVDVVVLEVDASGEVGSLEAFVRRVRGIFPSLSIVLYAPLNRAGAARFVRLANAGADELVLKGYDDERHALQRLIKRAHVSRCTSRSLSAVADQLPAPARAILIQSIHLAESPLLVGALARAVGVNRRTLVNRLNAAGLPGPETVISWCRLLLACELLEDPETSVERVALLLGFSSGVALRNMFRRHLGIPPSALRDSGGLDGVVRRMFGTPWPSPAIYPSGDALSSAGDRDPCDRLLIA